MAALGQPWPERKAVGDDVAPVSSGECAALRRFPTPTRANVTQGLSAPDGKRGITLLQAALMRPGCVAAPASENASIPEQVELFAVEEVKPVERPEPEHVGRLNPDWLEVLMGLPRGFTSRKPMAPGVFADWLRGWRDLDSWAYGPGWWLGYAPGTWDLPSAAGVWEQDIPRVTAENEGRSERGQAIARAIVPMQMAAAWGLLVERVEAVA